MTHFRPICLMPLSVSNNADNIVNVTPLRQKSVRKDISKIYKPIKTKFRKKLTSIHRRSAFCIFETIKPLLNAGKAISGENSDKSNTVTTSLSVKNFKSTLPNAIRRQLSKQQSSKTIITEESGCDDEEAATTSNANFNQTQKKPKTNKNSDKCCDAAKTRSSREKMLQEKEDFQLAKMLQECVTADSPSNVGSMRYSLRSRNKSSVSSLSSSSSSQEYLHSKGYPLAVSKFKKTTPFGGDASIATKDLFVGRSMRSTANDKIIDFNFQKLTRSRRIAMTMSGV